jgi:sulfotransferase family protein
MVPEGDRAQAPKASLPRPRVVFVTGAARSGTTWVQNMLGSHDAIATPQESDLFSRYIAPCFREWRKSIPDDPQAWADRRHNGLPSIITEEEFDEILGDMINLVYRRVAELKPSASIVLDKVPGYGYFGGLILRYLPDARILHLIRDGRDVTMSLQRASKGFGRRWAAKTVDYAAWSWQENIEAARELAGSDCYSEVRYEELRGADGAAALHESFRFLGVNLSEEEASGIIERFSLEGNAGRPPSSMVWGGEVIKRLGQDPEEPADFFGKGSAGGWRESFSWYDRWLFDRYAGEALVELGYEDDRSWAEIGPIRRGMGHVRFFAARWRGLVLSLFEKTRRNLKPRQRTRPSTAVPALEESVRPARSR